MPFYSRGYNAVNIAPASSSLRIAVIEAAATEDSNGKEACGSS